MKTGSNDVEHVTQIAVDGYKTYCKIPENYCLVIGCQNEVALSDSSTHSTFQTELFSNLDRAHPTSFSSLTTIGSLQKTNGPQMTFFTRALPVQLLEQR